MTPQGQGEESTHRGSESGAKAIEVAEDTR
jgi:hypothetical protein